MRTDDYLVSTQQDSDFSLSGWQTDAPEGVDKDEAKAEVDALTDRIVELQTRLFAESKQRLLVVLQATDTGGKDSTIRSIFGKVNPQGVAVTPFKKPSEEELAHDYLWRVHQHVPANGQIAVFNRSHYEDVLVVRVRELVAERRWKKRYEQIRSFEQMLVDEGTTIVKFFLNISKDEQKERLEDRLAKAHKHWKFNPADLAERELWDGYRAAYEEALGQTSTEQAPWYGVPANNKWFRNLVIAKVLVETLERMNPQFPEPADGLESITIE